MIIMIKWISTCIYSSIIPSSQWRRQSDNWGGGGGANIHIFVVTDHKNNGFQKKLIMQNTKI